MNKKLLLVIVAVISTVVSLIIYKRYIVQSGLLLTNYAIRETKNITNIRRFTTLNMTNWIKLKRIFHDKNHQFIDKLSPECKYGYFKVNGMENCRPWLNCSEIQQIFQSFFQNAEENKEAIRNVTLGRGMRKRAYYIPWINPDNNQSTTFAMSISAFTLEGIKTAQTGARNLRDLQPSKHVIKMTGYCEVGKIVMFLTENCGKYGSLRKFIKSGNISQLSATQRFKLAIQIVEGLAYLHYGSGTPKVHCDLHEPLQSMNQFLLTDDMNVVLNDVDEIPVDDLENNKVAICIPECQKYPTFLAPEQRFSRQECKMRFKRIKISSVKSDVWKIPDMTNLLLTSKINNDTHLNKSVTLLKDTLTPIHKQCKIENIEERASSTWVLQEYMKIYNNMIPHS